MEQDVGKLLLAGFIPGAVSALVYGGLIVCIAVYFKNVGPPVSGFTWKERFESLAPAFPIVAVIIIIIFSFITHSVMHGEHLQREGP